MLLIFLIKKKKKQKNIYFTFWNKSIVTNQWDNTFGTESTHVDFFNGTIRVYLIQGFTILVLKIE